MMRHIFFCIPFFSSLFGANPQDLEKCLLECYGIASKEIIEEFAHLDENYDLVVDAFIHESRKLEVYSGTPSLAAQNLPPHHSILFENAHLRVSRAVTKCGEQEPFQSHPWKTLIVVIHPSRFYSVQENGASYEDNWPAGAYLLDPSLDLLSCKNIGPSDYLGLTFEMKTDCD